MFHFSYYYYIISVIFESILKAIQHATYSYLLFSVYTAISTIYTAVYQVYYIILLCKYISYSQKTNDKKINLYLNNNNIPTAVHRTYTNTSIYLILHIYM